MKYLMFALLLSASLSVFGQSDFIISSSDWETLSDRAGKKIIESVDEVNDTMIIYRRWYEWQPGFGPGIACGVMNCNSDHRYHYRDRLIFYVKDDDIKFLRREIGRLEDRRKTSIVTEWVYRIQN